MNERQGTKFRKVTTFPMTQLKTKIFAISEKIDDVITFSKYRLDFFDPRLIHDHIAKFGDVWMNTSKYNREG